MTQASKKSVLFSRRALLVFGALLCLCASDSAGPRLLPLPALNVTSTVRTFSPDSTGASRRPSPNKEPNVYLQMVAGSQYRARDYQSDAQPATPALQASCQLQANALATAPETYASLKFKSAPLSIPAGRAPPRFV